MWTFRDVSEGSGKAGGAASGKHLAGNLGSLRSFCLSSIVDGMECFVVFKEIPLWVGWGSPSVLGAPFPVGRETGRTKNLSKTNKAKESCAFQVTAQEPWL